MKTHLPKKSRRAAFTLVEVMISMTVVTTVLAMCMSTFLFGLRMMYKDNQRLATNTNLRYFMAQVSKATLDASEFYIYPSYETLDGTIDSEADLTPAKTDSYGLELYHGDCLVLVTRMSLDEGSTIRQVSIYYRTTSDPNKEAAIRFYEGEDYAKVGGSSDSLDTILNKINLKSKPDFPGSRQVAARTLGRPKKEDAKDRYPVFCSKAPSISTENDSVSINTEVINGTNANNLLSSSSFNYTISPRR
jgi:type II secretory pathway pseudopilin PulG